MRQRIAQRGDDRLGKRLERRPRCADVVAEKVEGGFQARDAVQLQRELVPLARLLGQAYGVPGLKAALNLIGYDVGMPRPPLQPAPESAADALRDAIAHFEEIPA